MTSKVVTKIETVLRKFKELPSNSRTEVSKAVRRSVIQLQTLIKTKKLSGQVLKVRTGTLRRSIGEKVIEEATSITGVSSIDGKDALEYGPRHEYGFKGAEQVEGHLRTIKQAFGKSINPTVVRVKNFTRIANTNERSFMRTGLADYVQSGDFEKNMKKAEEAIAAKVNS